MAAKEIEEILKRIDKKFGLSDYRACQGCPIFDECGGGDGCRADAFDGPLDIEELFVHIVVRGRHVLVDVMELKEEIKNERRRVRKSG